MNAAWDALRVRWFGSWCPELDEALASLPAMEHCPHDLVRALMKAGGGQKRTALVTRDGEPLAVVPLRRRSRHWEPVAQNVCPRSVAAVRPGGLGPALAALRSDVRVEYWDEDAPLPPGAHDIHIMPTFRAAAQADHEAYWRQTGQWRSIQRARRGCASMEVRVDGPDSAAWTIHTWAATWRGNPARSRSIDLEDDILLGATYLQERGSCHVFQLLDGGEPVSGYVTYVDRGSLIFGQQVYLPAYRQHGVGVRLLDAIFAWAAASRLTWVDLGGGHAYKGDWAPQDGALAAFTIASRPRRLLRRGYRAARAIEGRVRMWRPRAATSGA